MEEYAHECVSRAANAALSHPGFPAHKAGMAEEEKNKKQSTVKIHEPRSQPEHILQLQQ